MGLEARLGCSPEVFTYRLEWAWLGERNGFDALL